MPGTTILTEEHKSFLASIEGHAVHQIEDGLEILSIRSVRLDQDDLTNISKVFLFEDEQIYSYQAGHLNQIPEYELFDDLDKELTNIQYLNNFCSDQIDTLEDFLFHRKWPRHFLDTWFKLRRDLTLTERVLSRNLIVLKQFSKNHANLEDEHKQSLIHNLGSIEAGIRTCQAEISRLGSVFNFYTSVKSEKMNQNIYLLALVSGVFLPLNLIVGFFWHEHTKFVFQ